jgi:O-antigen ligase
MNGDLPIRHWRAGLLPAASEKSVRARRAISPAESSAGARSQIPRLIRWSFLLFIFWMPLEGAGLQLLPTPGRIAGVPFFLSCLFAPKLCFRKPSAVVWCFSAYLGVAAFHGLMSPRGSGGLGAFVTMVQLLLFFWIAANLLRDSRLARQAMRTYAAATVILAVGTLAGLPGFSGHGSDIRTTACQYNPNDVAATAALGAVVLLGEFLTSRMKSRYRLLCGAAALPLVILITRTASRAGFAALLIGLAVFLLPGGQGQARRRLVAALGAVVVLLGALFMAVRNPVLEGRLGNFYHAGDVTRGHIYAAARQMVVERPIAGWGPVVAQNRLGARVNSKTGIRDAHNLLLSLLIEVGILGTLPFLVGLLLVIRASWRGRTGRLGLVPLALLCVVLTTNVAHTNLAWKPMWFVLAVAMASAVKGKHLRRVTGSRPLPARIVRAQSGIVAGAGNA